MTIITELTKIVRGTLKELGLHDVEVSFAHSDNVEHGDYSTNIALVLGKNLGRNPHELAEEIVGKLEIGNWKFLDRVEVMGPGFINFFLTKDFFVQELGQIQKKKDAYGKGQDMKGKKVMVEFTDPNPFKEFHIGHLYSNTVGESISRLFEYAGAKVYRANYQGDVGMHVAKAIWGMKQLAHQMPKASAPLPQKAKWLGMCYVAGAAVEETEKEELEKINKALYEKSDKDLNKLYTMGRRWSLEYFETIYKLLGTKFNHYYFESEVGKVGFAAVQKGLGRGVFEKSQGAVIFSGEKCGLHSRVFINSFGLPTYEAKELGLAPTKYKDFKYDLSVVVTGNEIIDYFKVLLAVLREMYPLLAEKTRHLPHGMVRIPEGKMSSRTGRVISALDFLDDLEQGVRDIMKGAGSEILEKEKESSIEKIAVSAAKYWLLRVGIGKDIVFDKEKSLSLQGESGPYLQYTYARCKSIERKAGISNAKSLMSKQISNLTTEELFLLRMLYRFPEVVQEATEKFSPNFVCNFIFDLSQRYNAFYNTNPVLKADTKESKKFRLLLTSCVAQVLKNGLTLLGIKTLERM